MLAQNFLLEPLTSSFSAVSPSPRQSHPHLPTPSGGVASTGHDSYEYLVLPRYGTRNFVRPRERCGSQERGCALSFHCRRVLASSQRAFALIAVERCNTSAVQALQAALSSGTRHRRATEISFHRISHRYDCRRKALRAILI